MSRGQPIPVHRIRFVPCHGSRAAKSPSDRVRYRNATKAYPMATRRQNRLQWRAPEREYPIEPQSLIRN
jgi:hypothetical protein